MIVFDRLLVRPTQAEVRRALDQAAAAANRRGGASTLRWPPHDLDDALRRCETDAEGVWSPAPPRAGHADKPTVAVAWWHDFAGRAHLRVGGWGSRRGQWPERPPLLTVYPEHTLARRRGGAVAVLCLCACGAWGRRARWAGWATAAGRASTAATTPRRPLPPAGLWSVPSPTPSSAPTGGRWG